MFGKTTDVKPKPKMNKNATSMQRRLKTPLMLTYMWFHWSFLMITTGIFFLLNYALWILLTYGGKTLYIGVISGYRVPNNYRPDAIRMIYYIDEKVIAHMLMPSIFLILLGITMLLIKHFTYKSYVKREVLKDKKKNPF